MTIEEEPTEYNRNSKVEKEGIDESNSFMENPFDPTKINIDTKTPSLDTLIKRIARKTISLDTKSYFQRKDNLWSTEQQSRLIESLLIRFPLPAFFFDTTDDDNWLVVDGLQRLSSIRNFCVDKTFKLKNLEFLHKLNGAGWDDLRGYEQRLIEETQVVLYKIMPGTPTDVKFNLFKRINTGGLILETQEIRHALFQGKPAEFIANLAENSFFIEATGGINTDRMLDRDFANRFLAFYTLDLNEYKSDLDSFMTKAIANVEYMSVSKMKKVEDAFTSAMKLSYEIFGNEAFRKISEEKINKRPPINKALFDALSTQLALMSNEEKSKLKNKHNKISFKKMLRETIKNDSDFFSSITNATGGKSKIQYRHSKIRELIQQNLN